MDPFDRRQALMGMGKRRLWKAALGALLLASCSGQVTDHGVTPGGGGGASGGGSGGGGGTPATGALYGTTVLHRLTRVEYTNTIRDLLGVKLVDVNTLPADGGGNGFTKDSGSQASSANTITAYEDTSNEIVDSLFADATLKGKLIKCDLATGSACIKSTLQTFLPKAWRRPVEAAEVDRLMVLAATEATAGGSADEQFKLALRAALTSSKFLYLLEKDPNPADIKPHPLGDYEVASRLSYFIWSSAPDDMLFTLASQGKLQDEATIAEQVTRMLADTTKGGAITDVFAAEWMQLGMVPPKQPDATMFPMVNDALKSSMVTQTTMFFQNILKTGAPLSDLVASDYTFVDAPLARLYGLPVPAGTGFSKVSLAGTTRIGGVLGQGSILMQYASQKRPSAVKRGSWVLESLLCAPSPPPPADVTKLNAMNEMDPAFQAKLAMQTAREHLAEHRAPAQCAVCHNTIDPLGLGLENYDAVGQYQTTDKVAANKPIDPSGQLLANDPTTKFADARGMVQLLGKDNRVASCIAEKLLTFALTRPPKGGEITYTVGRISGNTDTLPKAITAIATGTPLRTRAGAGL